jgi:hypothetical protein
VRGHDTGPHNTPPQARGVRSLPSPAALSQLSLSPSPHTWRPPRYKLFDRTSGHFYYAFTGKSRLIQRSKWKRPCYFGQRGYIHDVAVVVTDDVYAIKIQRAFRGLVIRNMLRTLTRANYTKAWDNAKVTPLLLLFSSPPPPLTLL